MQSARIIVTCVLAAIAYGIIHDEITAHLCVEYFTVAHPHIFPTTDPFWLAIGWGIIATWWVGLLLGSILAFVATHGPKPKVSTKLVISRIFLVLPIAGIGALSCGTLVYYIAAAKGLVIPDAAVPPAKHAIFFGVWAAHITSYGIGIIGGLAVILNIWQIRLGLKSASTEKD